MIADTDPSGPSGSSNPPQK